MKTTRATDLLRQASDPGRIDDARKALATAQSALDQLRTRMQEIPEGLPTPEARAAVQQAIASAGPAGFTQQEMSSAVAHLSTEELRIAAETALGTWTAYKMAEPLLQSRVNSERTQLEGLERLQGMSQDHPFLTQVAAFLLDRIRSAAA